MITGKKLVGLLLIAVSGLIACTTERGESQVESKEKIVLDQKKVKDRIRVNYDAKNLDLYLNDHLNASNVDWRWSHMVSNNNMPDTIGVEYYEDISQEHFLFNEEETVPFLSCVTVKNRLVEFSVVVIFQLPDRESKTIEALMDSAWKFPYLKEDAVRNQILTNRKWQSTRDNYEEVISLEFAEEGGIYDRLSYRIRDTRVLRDDIH